MASSSFNWHRHVTSAAIAAEPNAAAPLDWTNLPGATPVDKKQHIIQEVAQLLRGSANLYADAYGAVQNKPFQGGVSSPSKMLPVHQMYQQLQRYYETLPKPEQQEFLQLWDGTIQSMISGALAEAGHQFHPDLPGVFSERPNSSTKLNRLFQMPPQEIAKVVEAHRESWLGTLRHDIMRMFEDLESQFGITKAEFAHLLHVDGNRKKLQNVGEGEPGTFIQKVGGEAQAMALAKAAEKICSIRIGNIQNESTMRISHLFSGKHEQPGDRDIYPTPKPITREEVLGPLGLTMSDYPQDPHTEFDVATVPFARASVKTLTPEQLQAREAVREQNRKNPKNIALLQRFIVEGGFEYGHGLGTLLSRATRASDLAAAEDREGNDEDNLTGERRYPARGIYYIFNVLCNKNMNEFREMLDEAGYSYLKEDLNSKGQLDPVFAEFNLMTQSQAEQEVINKLRTFGLMATPLPISMPSPPGCVTNPKAFVIDFTIPCDVLDRWESRDGMVHPVVRETVVFVGEYFGFDRKQLVTIPQGQTWTNPDGSVATIKGDNGEDVPLVGGVQVERGVKYKISAQWKKMGEMFVAHATGNHVLHIEKDSKDRDIMAQLDGNHIIYQTKECPPQDGSCCVALHQLVTHASECPDPNCASKRFVGTGNQVNIRNYSPAEAYIISCLADLKIRYGLMPAMHTESPVFNREHMWQYFTAYNNLNHMRKEKWTAYQEARKSNSPDAKQRMLDYMRTHEDFEMLKKTHLGEVRKAYEQNRQSESYRVRESGLNTLLELIRSTSVPNPIVAKACEAYMGANPPASLPTYILPYMNRANTSLAKMEWYTRRNAVKL